MQTPIEFAKNFLVQVYTKQDVTAAMACLAPDMIWVTPEKSVHLKDQKEIYEFLKDEIQSAGQKYYVDVSNMMSDPSADTIRVVSFDVSLVPVDPKWTQYVRTSFVIRTARDGYEIPFFHMSHRFSLSDPVPFRMFIEYIPEPVMVVRGHGAMDLRLAFQNSWFRNHLGYTEKEFDNYAKKDAFFMFRPADRDALRTAFSDPGADAVFLRVSAKQKSGADFAFEVTGQYAFEEDEAKISYLVFHELGALIAAEQAAVEQAVRPLQETIRELTEQADTLKQKAAAAEDEKKAAVEQAKVEAAERLDRVREESASRIAMERSKADKIAAAAKKEQERRLSEQAASFAAEQEQKAEAAEAALRAAKEKADREYARLKADRDAAVRRLSRERDALAGKQEEAEASIASLQRQVQTSEEEAKKAEEGRREFLVRMQGDLRRPSEAVLSLLPQIEAGGLDDGQQDAVEKIREAAGIMLGMVDSLLHAAQLDNHERKYQEAEFVLPDLCREIRREAADWCRKAELELDFRMSERLPEVVCGDRDALKRVLLNILDNAVRYTNRGGKVSFSAGCGQPDGTVFPLHFEIIDTGIGIEDSLMPVLFEPFTRGHSNAMDPRMRPGFGLGLATANSLVRLMGGRIGVTSTPGVGSYFTVDVSVKAVLNRYGRLVEARDLGADALGEDAAARPGGETAAGAQDDDSAGGKKPAGGEFHGLRVLLTEDDPLSCRLIRELLLRRGMVVVTSSSGMETVRAFQNHRAGYYSAILVDYHMPGMDGLETARQIRATEQERARAAKERGHEAARPVPIIALTQNAFEEDMASSFGATIDAGISKPVEEKKLVHLLGRVIAGRETAAN